MSYVITGPSYEEALSLAKERARQEGIEYAVVLMDSMEDMDRQIWRMQDTYTDEFIAFDGRIEAVVFPEGDVDELAWCPYFD